MASTYATDIFNGNGSTDEFDLTFPFISRDHVGVTRIEKADGAETVLTVIKTGTPTGDEYRWENDTRIKVGTAPSAKQQIRIRRDTPENQQLVPWADGSYLVSEDLNTSDLQWLYGLQELEDKFGLLQTTAIKYLGAVDLTVDAAPVNPTGGDFFINTGAGTVVTSWTGIAGDTVVGAEQVIYSAADLEWQIFDVPSSQQGVLQVAGTSPIAVDNTDTQRPDVSITPATASAAGSMSAADKTKLDGIPADAEANVNADWNATSGDAEILNKPAIPADQVNSDWNATTGVAKILNKPSIPAAQVKSDWNATSGVAEILNKPVVVPEAPSDGKTYGRKDAAWSEVKPGGVTQIVAGNNVTISPSTGTGVVTVNSTGGGGGGGGSTTPVPLKVAYLRDEKPNNTVGGSAVIGWQDRTLNTKDDVNNLVVLSNDKEFTLSAGEYQIEWSAPAYQVDRHQTKLTNVTDGTTQEMGSSEYSTDVGPYAQTRSFGSTRVKITSDTTYKIEHNCGTACATYGLGVNGRTGEPEVYTQVTITDLAIVGGTGTAAKTNIYGTAKAWGSVASDGTKRFGTNFTVQKISDGVNEITFDTALSSADYAVVTAPSDSFLSIGVISVANDSRTTSSFRITTGYYSNIGNYVPYNYSFDFTVTDNTPAEVALTTFGDVINYSGPSAWGTVSSNGTLNNGLNCSVSRSGAGVYAVTFSSPLPNANYSVTATQTTPVSYGRTAVVANKTANQFIVYTYNDAQTSDDRSFDFTVHATNALPPKGGTGTDAWATVDETTVNGPCNVPGSFNVASVTRTGAGVYDVVFTTPMPTANYSIAGSGGYTLLKGNTTTSGCTLSILDGNDNYSDYTFDFQINATNATLPSTITQGEVDLILDTIKGAGVAQKVAILVDQKPTGTNGGSTVAGWQDRTLNTVVSDEGNLVTLANDKEFTLKAGTYLIEWSAPAYYVNSHQTKLTNVTDGTTQEMGSNAFTYSTTSNVVTSSFGSTRVKITSDTTYKIEHYCESAHPMYGLGVSSTSGGPEVYAQVTITDLGVLAVSGGIYWDRTGTTLSPVNAGDDVEIGSGKITLNGTYGSATFAGKVTSISTVSGDGGTTLATKDYVDPALNTWKRSSSNSLEPVNSGDTVILESGLRAFNGTKNFLIMDNYGNNSSVGLVVNNGNLVLGAGGGIGFASGLATTTSSGGSPLQVFAESGVYRIYSFTSLRAYKTNIQSLPSIWDKVKALSPCSFNGIGEHDKDINSFGFVAEEVDEVDAHFGTRDENGLNGVSYPAITVALTAALKEAMARIETLEAKVQTLETISEEEA